MKTKLTDLFTTLFITFVLIGLTACGAGIKTSGNGQEEDSRKDSEENIDTENSVHAQIVVFMMPRCSYCAQLLKVLLPLKKELGKSIQLGFAYVGAIDDDGNFTQSDAEVDAATMQMCVGMTSTESQWLDFMYCIYKNDTWKNLPNGYLKCANKTKLNIENINKCISSGDGKDQLRASVKVSMQEQILAAPTMFINGVVYRSGMDKESILSHICHLTGKKETMPNICSKIAKPSQVNATLIVDNRCENLEECNVERELAFLKSLLPAMKIVNIDYNSPQGRKLYKEIQKMNGPETLPLLVFNESLAKYTSIKSHLDEYLIEFGNGYIMPLGLGWNPDKEICDNKIDDNENNLIDCADDDCAQILACREEKNHQLDLFIMSQCPFAAMIIPFVDHFLAHFDYDKEQVNFKLQFIGSFEENKLDSMHGLSEVEEDLRIICAQHLYDKNYKFMEYVTCRAKRYHSDDWEECVPKWMNKKRLLKCSTGKQGRELLANSFALAQSIGLQGSPTWMLNDKFEINSRTAEEIFKSYCDKNESKYCNTKIKPLAVDENSEGEKYEYSNEKCE